MRYAFRAIALVLVCAMILPVCAFADTTTVYIIANTLKIYSSYSTSSTVLGTMSYGESLEMHEYRSGWARVENARGEIGYCELTGLTKTDPNQYDMTVYAQSGGVVVYAKASTSSRELGELGVNDSVTVLAVTKDDQWCRVENESGEIGYVLKSKLGPTKVETSQPEPDEPDEDLEPEEEFEEVKVYVTSMTLKIYGKTSTSSTVLGTMSYGESMTLVAISGDWAQVRNAYGDLGYCALSSLTKTDPNKYNDAAYVTESGTVVYAKPLTTAKVRATLSAGAQVTVVAITENGEWCRVANGSSYGYVLRSYLSTSPVEQPDETPDEQPDNTPAEKTVYVISNTLPIYQISSTSSKVLGTMSFGQSMTLVKTSGSWAQVKNESGAYGYCQLAGISETNPNKYDTTIYVVSTAASVYAKPLTSAKITVTLPRNAEMQLVGVTADDLWCRVYVNGKYGYIEKSRVNIVPVEDEEEEETPSLTGTVYVASNTLPIYGSASTSGKVLGTMSYGESMTLVAVSGDWAQVKNANGDLGYCALASLTKNDPNTYNATGYAVESGVVIYAKPLTTAKVRATLALNGSVTVVAVTADGVWCRVVNGSTYGYVQAVKIANAPVADDDGEDEIGQLSGTVYVTAGTLKIYQTSSTSSKVLGTMSFGDSMTLVVIKDGWAQVKNHLGAIGYCDADSISATNPATGNTPVYVQADGAVVYAKPLTSAKVLATKAVNDSLIVVGTTSDGAWCRVVVGDSYGFIEAAKVGADRVEDSTEDEEPEQETVTVYVISNTLKIYQSNSTSSKALGTMSFGQSMRMTGYSNGWARVLNDNGAEGYCQLSGISKTDPSKTQTTMYVRATGVKIYAKPLTSAKVMDTLSYNEKVTVVATTSDDAWCRVAVGDSYGYVEKASLATSAGKAETTVYAISTKVNIYANTSTSSEVVGTMSFGESTKMFTASGDWVLIETWNGTGYCRLSDLSKTDPNTKKYTCYAQREGVKVYVEPSDTAGVTGTLSINDSVVCVMLSGDGTWCRVKYNGGYAYVKKSDLDTSKVASSTVYVVENTLKIYATQSEYGKVLGTLSYGQSMVMVGEDAGWAYVENSNGDKGYCLLSGVSTTNPNTYNKTGYAKTDGVKVYSKPLTSASTVATLDMNDTVTVVAMTDDEDWLRVQTGSVFGYVQSSQLSASKVGETGGSSSDDSDYSESMESLIALAKTKLGCTYVYATQGPNTFDCSGFTNYLYRTIYGITLSRSAYGQGYQTKYPIITDLADLRPGDILCLNTNETDSDMCDHVALYLGNGQFIHASYTAGKVIISSFTNYYKRVFWRAFRPVS